MVTSRVRGAAAAAKRPNLLLIMADQHRGDCLRSAGNRAIYTPNLDRLAAEGARFRCAYSSTPTCTPARAALLTGMSPWGHGMLGYSRVGEKYPVEMPRVLAEAGYYTMAIGKLHYHPQRNIHGFHQALLDESGRAESPEFRSDYRSWFWTMAPGLDPDATGIGWNDYRAKAYALPEQLHPTRWAGETAARFISAYDRSQPFFLKVSFERPHSPYDPPERLISTTPKPICPGRRWESGRRATPRRATTASISGTATLGLSRCAIRAGAITARSRTSMKRSAASWRRWRSAAG